MRKTKKWLALLLAACMAIPNVAGYAATDVSVVQAAEETAKTWDEWAASLKENATMAVQLTGDEQKFDGTKVLDVSEYADALKNVSSGSIIMRFKADSLAKDGVILGTSNSATAIPSDVKSKNANKTSMVITTADQIYLVYSWERAGIGGPYSFKDGDWHTIVLSASATGKSMRFTIDGREVFSLSNRSDLLGMFSKQTGLDTVTIGAHKSNGAVVHGFNGSISDVIVTTEEISDADAIALSAAGHTATPRMGSAVASTMLDISLRDNTFLFTGGEAVQGGFDQTRGIRNYIGQFEEYIRWRKIDSSPVNARQRYTFNTATAGQTLADIVENFDARVAAFKTKAIVYMVGVEDYSLGTDGVAEFKANLKSFIDQSLALKDNGAFAIIQKPFAVNDADANEKIELYCAAVDEVTAEYASDTDKFSRVLVVDHYTNTKDNADFKANKLTNNKLNANGHLAVSQQFAEAVVNYTGSGYPHSSVALNRVELEQADEYLSVQPTAAAGADSLAVEIPAVEGVTSWKYELDMDDVTVSGTADANAFEIAGLVAGADYVLKIQSADGEKQLVTTKGTITEGNTSVKDAQVRDEKLQKIADKMATGEPMTWLFMGDSITHGSGLTYGYDGIAQAFEEFVKEGLGRTDDIVLNTAVANANTVTTLQEIDQRLTNYNPDVISLMIGTNDCSSRESAITLDVFRNNMITILDTIKTNYPDAVVILRSMTPFFNDGNREPYRQSYMDVVEEMAETYDTIYIDQYTSLAEATKTYTWLPGKMFTDNLHPEANGHRVMTNMFIKACGLWTEDTPMTNLFYSMDIAEETNAATPAVDAGTDQISVSVTNLESKSGLSLGDVVLKATSETSGQTYETSVKDGVRNVVLNNLPEETTYTVEVSAHVTNAAKKVTFNTVEVTLEAESGEEPEVTPGETKVEVDEYLMKAGSISVTEENVTKGQPFKSGTADCAQFRIPALITLDNGDLLAAADARWRGGADWGGLDTIASVSSDNGETWSYSFPIWFPDTDETIAGTYKVATTAIDPVLVQGNDGTIYCIADMNPSGITTGDIMPAPELGYVNIDGTMRLVLTDTYTQPTSRNWSTYGNPESYEYYVGDFDEAGFAKVLNKDDDSATDWLVDEWYNLYKLDKTDNTYKPLTQQQVIGSETIQQNAFYKDSELHVYNTGYLWLVTSTDNGRTWGNPTILNTQIKREGEVALLASPGQGMVASNGDIIIPFYDHGDNQENASIIWSSDNGKTWTRSNDVSGLWSSENEVVELNNGVLRMFFRNGQSAVCYADFTKVGDTWVAGSAVQTAISVCSTCNVSAIRHSETIDGKIVVFVACPGGSGRANGKVFTFLVDEDNSMELYNTYSVNSGYYAYSCITELNNGNLGLLWEDAATAIRYDELSYREVIGLEKNIVIDQGDVYVEEKAAEEALEIKQAPNEKVATVTSELVVEEAKITLHDHVSNTASSLASFAATAGTASLENAEMVLTNVSGNVYKAYHPATGKYVYKTTAVQLSKADSADSAAQQVVFEPRTAADGTVTFRFYRASNSDRYTVFYNKQMNFNAMGTYNASWADGSYELVLLEKQDAVSNNDVLPGYTRATEITSGNTYILAYIWTDGSVIVFYPDASDANSQTKLVGDVANVAKNVITITGIAPGETTAVVGDVVYNITVKDPTLSPSYSGADLSTEGMKLTAGSLEPSEGSLEALFDGNPATFYHSNWSGTRPTDADFWITIELPEVREVSGLRYLPRQNSQNGRILSYVISYSVDGDEWTEAASGDWEDNAEWKLARFDENVEAKYVKIFATDSKADSSGRHLTAAELRLTFVEKVEEPDVPEIPETEVCKVFVDVEHDAWYEESVQYVYDEGIIVGDGNVFAPYNDTTRAMVAVILYRLAGSPEVTDYTNYNQFTDLPAEHLWYSDAVAWALNEGVSTGDDYNMLYNPTAPVTREQLALFLWRYTAYTGEDVTVTATEEELFGGTYVNEWAKEGFAWAVDRGIIKGAESTDGAGNVYYDLNPQGGATRAQFARMLHRFCEGNHL